MDGQKIGEQFKTMGQFETEPNKRDAWVPLELEGGESVLESEIERKHFLLIDSFYFLSLFSSYFFFFSLFSFDAITHGRSSFF